MRKSLAQAKRRKLEHYPQIVQIETTTVCNANCVMCPHGNITREKGHMNFDLYKKTIDDCNDNTNRLRAILPFLNGELFLTPKWQDYLAYARTKLPTTRIEVYTNGSLLNDENIHDMLEIGPDVVNISFDGVSKEAYEAVRRNLDFDEVQNNITQLVRQRDASRKGKPHIAISIIEMEQTAAGIEAFQKKWAAVVDEVIVVPYSNWADIDEREHGNEPGQGQRMPCPRLWVNLTILNTGKAVLCCLDYNGDIILGDVTEQSVEEIWTGEKLQDLRKLHLEGKHSEIPRCKNCSYLISCLEPLIW
ncbi:radical SAM/SPASM domain-containing protein [Gemmatimonadota bacterium]